MLFLQVTQEKLPISKCRNIFCLSKHTPFNTVYKKKFRKAIYFKIGTLANTQHRSHVLFFKVKVLTIPFPLLQHTLNVINVYIGI
jgi:hypothetical protein